MKVLAQSQEVRVRTRAVRYKLSDSTDPQVAIQSTKAPKVSKTKPVEKGSFRVTPKAKK